jgi:hypothetical protein
MSNSQIRVSSRFACDAGPYDRSRSALMAIRRSRRSMTVSFPNCLVARSASAATTA